MSQNSRYVTSDMSHARHPEFCTHCAKMTPWLCDDPFTHRCCLECNEQVHNVAE